MHRKLLLIALLLIMATSVAFGQCTNEPGKALVFVPIGDLPAGVVNWTNGNVYVLQGPTYVTPATTLNIEAGTIIKGIVGLPPGDVASLIVQRGAQIFATGTEAEPIIFTACTDDLTDPFDLTNTDRGLWGSLILLGNAPINTGTVDAGLGETCLGNNIEGLPPGAKTRYGGCDCDDNSGVVQYVVLKHGGSVLGAANEINGLTFGGVGAGTTIDHIEVYANADDGYEWFGGTVNCKYLVSSFNDDDSFDWDQGYNGKLQFLFSIYNDDRGDRTFEIDSDDGNIDSQPYSRPTVYNVTAYGQGNTVVTAQQDVAIKAKENTGGHIRNAIFYDFPREGVEFEDEGGTVGAFNDCSGVLDAEKQSRCWTGTYVDANYVGGCDYSNPLYAGVMGNGANLTIYGTLWYNIGPDEITTQDDIGDDPHEVQRLFVDYPALATTVTGQTWANVIDNPRFYGQDDANIRVQGANAIDPRPAADGPAFDDVVDAPTEDAFFDSAPYRGAFNATDNWLCNWTCLWSLDYLRCDTRVVDCKTEVGKTVVPVGPASPFTSFEITENTVWNAENIYLLQGPTFVTNGASLFIEKGTIIKGEVGLSPGEVSSLIITRNGKIFAEGTEDCPIIFTAETDDIDVVGDLLQTDRGLWGSLILLGNAPINTGTIDGGLGEVCLGNNIEGLPPVANTRYGGCDCNDNSGVVTYVELKHGGSVIGAANEINGLTFGGVGAGTTIDHVEVYANADDGYEWFGGNVNCTYLVSAFNDDDSFDWDQGYNGKLQFLFSIYNDDRGDRTFEIDGDDGNIDADPKSRPIVYNVTAMGQGENVTTAQQDVAIKAKENTGGHIRNAIFVEFPREGVEFEDEGGTVSLAPIPDCATTPTIDAEYHSRCASGSYTDANWVSGCVYDNPAFAVADLDIYGTVWCMFDPTAMTSAALVGDDPHEAQRVFTDYPTLGGAAAGIGTWDNIVANPLFTNNDRTMSRVLGANALDPRPAATSVVFSMSLSDAPAEDAWFASAPYAGAFNSTDNWLNNWTALYCEGFLATGSVPAVICGDADCSGAISIGDAVFIINYIFGGGPAPCTDLNGDADGSGAISIGDAVYIINYIFGGGPAPKCSCS